MAGPLLLAENFWNPLAFPAHDVTASEEIVNYERWKVGVGRRASTNYWSPFTPNTAHWNQVQCDRVRGANCCFLDRGHNLAGYQVQLQASMDGTNWIDAFNVTLPTATAPNDLSDTSYGVRTEEGAWGMLFPQVAGLYWRLYVPAMGAGLMPQVVGLYVGMAYQPGLFWMPSGEDQTMLTVEEVRTPVGWRGRTALGNPRQNQITLKLPTEEEYDLARAHIQGHFGAGMPTWICYDIAQGDRAFLAIRLAGQLGFNFDPQWFPRECRFTYEEHEWWVV